MINRSNELRQNNREAIMREILKSEQISRHEIIDNTGLAPSTVSTIMKEILDEGIIRKSGKLSTPGTGRKTDLFSRNPSHAGILVVNLTFENSSLALVDLEFNISREMPIRINDFSSEAVARSLKPAIESYTVHPSHPIHSIVLALPHFPYDKEKLRRFVSEESGLPVYTINNVEAMGLYDSSFQYRPFNSLVYIFVGKGIGSAFFHRGELLMGENGFASDLGHIHITDRDIECRCGRKGCLETVASEDALSTALSQMKITEDLRKGSDLMETIREAIDDRTEDVQNLITDAASYLAESMLTIISLLDPQAIILTGRICSLNPFLSQKLEEHLYSKSGKRSLYNNKLIYQEYRQDSTAKGAALYAYLSAYGGFNKAG